jgi:hypothetical protein
MRTEAISRQGRLRRPLLTLLTFLAVTSVAGGIGLLTGVIAPTRELLRGTLFSTYTVPGLALLVMVGGSAIIASSLVLRRHPLGCRAAAIAAAMIVTYELVEVLVIGSAPGVARTLQILYFCVGIGIAGIAAIEA